MAADPKRDELVGCDAVLPNSLEVCSDTGARYAVASRSRCARLGIETGSQSHETHECLGIVLMSV